MSWSSLCVYLRHPPRKSRIGPEWRWRGSCWHALLAADIFYWFESWRHSLCLSAAPAEEVQNEDEEVDDVHVKLDAGNHVVVAALGHAARVIIFVIIFTFVRVKHWNWLFFFFLENHFLHDLVSVVDDEADKEKRPEERKRVAQMDAHEIADHRVHAHAYT